MVKVLNNLICIFAVAFVNFIYYYLKVCRPLIPYPMQTSFCLHLVTSLLTFSYSGYQYLIG